MPKGYLKYRLQVAFIIARLRYYRLQTVQLTHQRVFELSGYMKTKYDRFKLQEDNSIRHVIHPIHQGTNNTTSFPFQTTIKCHFMKTP